VTSRARGAATAALIAAALSVAGPARAEPNREVNWFPIVGGDSDIGLGAGIVGDWVRFGPAPPEVDWRADTAAFISFKLQNAKLVIPFADVWVELLVPRWRAGGRLHLDARLSFTNEQTLKYTGIGNASPPFPSDLTLIEYERLHPTAWSEVRVRVTDTFFLLGGASFTYNHLDVPSNTVLAMQQASGPPEVRELLGSFAPHGVALFTAEAQIDTRDDESVTTRGQFHTLRFRGSPHVGGAFPYGYERATLTTRFYGIPLGLGFDLRLRLVGDVLFGDAPFYELARFDETAAIGGGKAVRGVPAQRYYGKVKAFGNIEVTRSVWAFSVWEKPCVLGVEGFFDAGRTWTELGQSNPQLDGTGFGLKYGVGGGLRLLEGRTFIVRLEIAWSPDANPVGAYFAAGQLF
jgi:hypothetical protein